MIGLVATVKSTATVVTLAVLAAWEWWVGLGPSIPESVNVVLNGVTLLGLLAALWAAPKAFRAKAAEAMVAERDKIIDGHRQLAELKTQEAEAAKAKTAELGAILDESRVEAASWQAKYEEQSRYTAQPALEAIQVLLKHNNDEAERRHSELLLALRAFASKRFHVDEPPSHAGA